MSGCPSSGLHRSEQPRLQPDTGIITACNILSTSQVSTALGQSQLAGKAIAASTWAHLSLWLPEANLQSCTRKCKGSAGMPGRLTEEGTTASGTPPFQEAADSLFHAALKNQHLAVSKLATSSKQLASVMTWAGGILDTSLPESCFHVFGGNGPHP